MIEKCWILLVKRRFLTGCTTKKKKKKKKKRGWGWGKLYRRYRSVAQTVKPAERPDGRIG